MKVIDLLNKIANGEIPLKIEYDKRIYEWNDKYKNYFDKGNWEFRPNCQDFNKEVEIIEDKEDINIQDIEELNKDGTFRNDTINHQSIINIQNKINELVQAVKHLEKTKEDK